jgi:hypothetical protein
VRRINDSGARILKERGAERERKNELKITEEEKKRGPQDTNYLILSWELK